MQPWRSNRKDFQWCKTVPNRCLNIGRQQCCINVQKGLKKDRPQMQCNGGGVGPYDCNAKTVSWVICNAENLARSMDLADICGLVLYVCIIEVSSRN